ncbi:hypothetical protein like AT3G24255 [Hibiscus trionum]|uniref:Reverse transcriptase domain-containing protein n=1 Tax=Hibiscus trionum TaxID=183268 RepID=A0A9W7J6G1_HIBTR|nr:hypothetical protein like AT3G24255 [Hibiscus trionum]
MAMNCLLRLLDVAAVEGIFQYHLKCGKIGLANLCFVDDLLVFYNGTLDSLNTAKSDLFIYGVKPDDVVGAIFQETGFRLSSLPVRYLGVPLATHMLTKGDCHALLDKVRAKIGQLSACNLSFAGRLQLIRSVLYGVLNFCTRQLLLPKTVQGKVNQHCSCFLEGW